MQLTEKAIRCQELGADMTLIFGCMVFPNYNSRRVKMAKILRHFGGGNYRVVERIDTSRNDEEYIKDYGHDEYRDYENNSFQIYGNPLNRGRLCYLYYKCERKLENDESFWTLNDYFRANPEAIQQTIIERQHNDELMELMLSFLESLQ